jgi:hypothetical protein
VAAQISLAPLQELLVQQLTVAVPPEPGSPLGRALAALTDLLGAEPCAWPDEVSAAAGLRSTEVLRQVRLAYAWAGPCTLDSYLSGNGSTSTTVRLTGATGNVELALEVDGSGELLDVAISLGRAASPR